jgi:hypothetical protein
MVYGEANFIRRDVVVVSSTIGERLGPSPALERGPGEICHRNCVILLVRPAIKIVVFTLCDVRSCLVICSESDYSSKSIQIARALKRSERSSHRHESGPSVAYRITPCAHYRPHC